MMYIKIPCSLVYEIHTIYKDMKNNNANHTQDFKELRTSLDALSTRLDELSTSIINQAKHTIQSRKERN